MAACLVLVAVIGLGFGQLPSRTAEQGTGSVVESNAVAPTAPSLAPSAYVDIDVNPSLEFALDEGNTVIGVEGLNADGVEAISDTAFEGLSYAAALDELLANDRFAGYLSVGSFVSVNVVADDPEQQQSLMRESESCLQTLPCASVCAVASNEFRAEAQRYGMGCGRYRAALEYVERHPGVTIDDCAHMTMRQLREDVETSPQAFASPDEKGWRRFQGQGCRH